MSYGNGRMPDFPEDGFADDEAAREFGRQLAMDLVLEQLYHQGDAEKDGAAEGGAAPVHWLKLAAPIAAVFVLLGMVQLYRTLDSEAPRSPIKPSEPPGESMGRWAVEPVGEAEFSEAGPFRVRLEDGQLKVPVAPGLVTVELEHAVVTAHGAEFQIGTTSNLGDNPFPGEDELRVTRVQIVSGTVTIETEVGTLTGEAGEVLEFRDGAPPRKITPEEQPGQGLQKSE